MEPAKKRKAPQQANLHRFFAATTKPETQSKGDAEPTVAAEACSNLPDETTSETTTSDEPKQPVHHDISDYTTGRTDDIDDATKYNFIKERIPPSGFKFPPKAYKDKRRETGVMYRHCNREWFDSFKFIAYSKAQDGLYCLCCVLFPTAYKYGISSLLIKQPYNNWKDAKADLKSHATCGYHKSSEARMEAFMHTMVNPTHRIDLSMSSKTSYQVQKNRTFLLSVIKCLELCGRQGLALRGHRDAQTDDPMSNKGNFHSFLQFRVDSGDIALKEHLETCTRNATYISKTSQNQLLECIKRFIQETFVNEINNHPFGSHYGIMADEVTDVSNWEQLGLLVRYVKNNQPVERLLFFAECEEITGRALCDTIISGLSVAGLDPANCRAQCFDGAGNMAGVRNGCAANFKKTATRAPYFHCASHDLNLALCKACKVPAIHCIMETLKTVGIFFKYSPKRQRELERAIERVNENRRNSGLKPLNKTKIKPMCETRWVEKHNCLGDFLELHEPLTECLEAITTESGWDAKARVEAGGLLSQITSSSFLCAFQSAVYIFGFTKTLSVLLQGSSMDVITAYEKVDLVLNEMRTIRANADEEFKRVFEAARNMAEKTGHAIEIPRRCKRQTMRSNVEADTPETYYRRSVFVPFVDNMVEQLASRFSQLTLHACRALLLMPANLENLTEDHGQKLRQFYEPDLPSPLSFEQELRLWKSQWHDECDKPASLQLTLSHKYSNQKVYPNVCAILQLLMLTPVTSAGVERANSALRYIKNVYRSTMKEDRLNALILLYVHRDIQLDYDRIMDIYSTQHPHRMLFINPLSE